MLCSSFGAIGGFGQAFWTAGVGLGPLIAATAFDLTSSYEGIFVSFVGAYVLAALLIALLQTPAANA